MKTLKMLFVFVFIFFFLNLQAQKAFEVEVSGKEQPILLFSGFTSTGKVYENIIEMIAEKYEVHTFTFTGFGGIPAIEKPWFPKIKILKYAIDPENKQLFELHFLIRDGGDDHLY